MNRVWAFLRKLWNAETGSRKWTIFTLAATTAIIGGAALLVFTIDPHYRYRDPLFYDKVYYEVYATAPAILQRENYDLLMLGTSMTRNFFIENIDSAFNCRSVKLAASGGTVEDLCKFFELALESKGDKLKQVIWSLDIYPLNKSGNHYSSFDYLYRKDHKEDYRYLFSRQTYSSIYYLYKRKSRPKRYRAHQSDRNRMFATEYKGKPYGLQEVVADAIHNDKIHHSQTPYHPRRHRENLYGKLLPVFDRNPQIKFTVYLPPYHIFTYCQSESFGEADALIKQRTCVMLELLKRPNVELHDFQSAPEYVENHDYFSDVQHFSNPAAKKVLADLISRRRKISTPEEVKANEAALRALIKKNMPEYTRLVTNAKER